MTGINLLPWRETLREEIKKEWLLLLSLSLVLAIFILVTVCTVLTMKIRHTVKVNNALHYKIRVLSDSLLRIKEIQQQQSGVAARIRVFSSLQKERVRTAAVLASMVSQIPYGVYLTLVYKKDQQWMLEGVAESARQVSTLMRHLAEVPVLAAPRLVQVKIKDNKTQYFEISLSNYLREEGIYGSG